MPGSNRWLDALNVRSVCTVPSSHAKQTGVKWSCRCVSGTHGGVGHEDEHGYSMLAEGATRKDWPRPIDPAVLKRWEDEEKEIEFRLFARMGTFIPEDDYPVVDKLQPFTIRWRGFPCVFDDTDGFKIIEQ